MNGGLAGQVVLVSGAGSGIGRAAAMRLAHAGAAVALVGRTAERLAETRDAIANAGVESYPGDIGETAAVDAIVKAVLARFSRIDILVNAAGINVRKRSLAEGSVEDFEKVVETNLRGAFLLSRAAARSFTSCRTPRSAATISRASHIRRRSSAFAASSRR
jgi:3-oxoacyl-[acyl-carrier protein] reductase